MTSFDQSEASIFAIRSYITTHALLGSGIIENIDFLSLSKKHVTQRFRFTEFHLEQKSTHYETNVSSMYLTMDVRTDQQAISQDWPTEESFQRKEILKWRDIQTLCTKLKMFHTGEVNLGIQLF